MMALVTQDLFKGTIDKVKIAIDRIKAFEPPEGYYVAFSGGKDSVVILDLVKRAGAIQHVSKRNVFAMLEWLHEQQAKPRKELFNQKEVLYDQNRSHNAGL